MCGILGLFRPSGLDPEGSRKRLEKAAALMAHRGPDASGITVLPQEGVAFGHRRLAILDLDPRSNQPMASSDGSLTITYNGEIYNFRALREELRKEGASFRTESDTEVVLEGCRAWGLERFLSKAAGMFAFALYDAKARRLCLARDRAGKKPLFYAEQGAGLAFASELRGLLSLMDSRPGIDPAGLDAYLALKFTPPPRTLVQGVSKLPPGSCLVRDADGESRVMRYWHPHQGGARPRSPQECLERLEAAFATAVERRLVSDVPVCLFLSGGIDSSLIAAFLAKIGAAGMTAYTIGYGDLPGYNEFDHARLVAKRFPLRHEEIVLESRQALETLEDESASPDEPVSDWVWVPLDHLSRRARKDGFKVVLVGEGADELFFGYDAMLKGLSDLRFYENPLGRALAWMGSRLLAPVYRRARHGHRRYDRWRRAAEGGPVYLGSSVGFGLSQRRQVAGPRLLAEGDAGAGEAFVESLQRDWRALAPDPSDAVNRISYVEYFTKMTEVLLMRVDRVTMRHSLEARSPFLDHELVELAFSIPGEWKIQGGLKGLLKELARRHLPEGTVSRKKMGFSFPFKEWLRGELGEHVERTFLKTRLFADGWVDGGFCRGLLQEHRSGWFDHAPRLWALYDLARWYDRRIA